jgi:hypothetical protein
MPRCYGAHMFERTDPKVLKKWLIVAAIVYFLFPFDAIPDLLGLPGRVDDLGVMALLAWFYRKHVAQFIAQGLGGAGFGAAGAAAGGGGSHATDAQGQAKAFDAHEILGVPRSASGEAIQAAYRARMKEYHPDKVAHLGEELQQLAHSKSQQIQRAYQQLRR